MALNGILNKGVPVDWATHMIGHELTALYEIDHARTLAIIAPNLYRVLLETKQDKLIQYGKRVWNISTGTPTERANQAIDKTTQFFQQLGVPTKLSEYTPDFAQTADFIVKRFEHRGWVALGERQNIDLVRLRQIVEMSY